MINIFIGILLFFYKSIFALLILSYFINTFILKFSFLQFFSLINYICIKFN